MQSYYTTKAYAEAVVRRYPPGSAVPVAYDPAHPDVACLEPGVIGTCAPYFFIGLPLVGLGLYLAFVLVRIRNTVTIPPTSLG